MSAGILMAALSGPVAAADWVMQRLTNIDGTLSPTWFASRDLDDNGYPEHMAMDFDGNGYWELNVRNIYGTEHVLENLEWDVDQNGVPEIYAVNTDQFGDFDCLMTFDPVYGWSGSRAQPLPVVNPNPATMFEVPCSDPYNRTLDLIGTGGTGVSGGYVGGQGHTPDNPADLLRGYFTQLQQCGNFTILDSNTHCLVTMPGFSGR